MREGRVHCTGRSIIHISRKEDYILQRAENYKAHVHVHKSVLRAAYTVCMYMYIPLMRLLDKQVLVTGGVFFFFTEISLFPHFLSFLTYFM